MISAAIITLTTDFGLSDSYVAQMKGVILKVFRQDHAAPSANQRMDPRLIDVTHDVPPQDIRRGAAILTEIVDVFPRGTIHLAVIDPGVGGDRRIVAADIHEQFFVAPDNGLLGELSSHHAPREIIELDPGSVATGRDVSRTFHGRDVLAPAAARLALGKPLSDLGSPSNQPLLQLPDHAARALQDGVEGEVVWIDHFGNAITSITKQQLGKIDEQHCTVTIENEMIRGISSYYAQSPTGSLLALWGSNGHLEIAVANGHAADCLQLHRGSVVSVRHGDNFNMPK